MLNNENTWKQGKEQNTLWGNRGEAVGVGSWGQIAWGSMPDIGEGEEGGKSQCHV